MSDAKRHAERDRDGGPAANDGESDAPSVRPDQGAGKRVGVRDIESGRDGQEDARSHQRPIVLRGEGKDIR